MTWPSPQATITGPHLPYPNPSPHLTLLRYYGNAAYFSGGETMTDVLALRRLENELFNQRVDLGGDRSV